MSGSVPGCGSIEDAGEARERGSRRKKLAGYLKAANDIRQSYQQSYAEKWGSGNGDFDDNTKTIPGSFPDVAIVSHGDEQLILFPSYAKKHVKQEPPDPAKNPTSNGSDMSDDGPGDAEYWAREWQKFEDDRAIVDVDVRGWIYSPHRGPMSRKNRVLIGLARQLSGIPAPKDPNRENNPDSSQSLMARHQEHEARRDEERIAHEADQILSRGRGEGKAAAQGRYSENPEDGSDFENTYGGGVRSGPHSGSHSPTPSAESLGPGHLSKRPTWNQPSDMSQAELTTANAHMMARLKPFLTNPLVGTPITVFFCDEKSSVSRTVSTNDAGHFIMRAALDFVPTHVRVLASQHLSATEEVKITQPKGVSLISDVDDTIKHSSIGGGPREIFRNAFIRDLGDLTIEGVKEWYNTLYDMGVGVHYVSNSPWQLFPVLVSFFQKAGLPPGSYHLKQYSGMLQGIFEPVAERKKGTLERIMKDFPERKFILIGDSGEADLEVYTDVALSHPGKIIGIFIRDVTTPESKGFFDSAMGPLSGDRRKYAPSRIESWDSRKTQSTVSLDSSERRPTLPPRSVSEVKSQTSAGPAMGKLIDFDEEPVQIHKSHRRIMPRSASTFETLESPRRRSSPESPAARVPPPRPQKPVALRGVSTSGSLSEPALSGTGKASPPPPPKPRRPNGNREGTGTQSHPLARAQSIADVKLPEEESYVTSARQKVSAAYNALPEVRTYMPGPPAPPPGRATSSTNAPGSASIQKRMSWNSTDTSDDERPNTGLPVNKKMDLWRRRWKRAKDILDSQGVYLRAWRVGGDVCLEAVQMVEKAMRDMKVEGYGDGGKGKGKTGEGGGEMKTKHMRR